MTTSRITHGALTEPSLIDHIGKGREGKGIGEGRESCRDSHSKAKSVTREALGFGDLR